MRTHVAPLLANRRRLVSLWRCVRLRHLLMTAVALSHHIWFGCCCSRKQLHAALLLMMRLRQWVTAATSALQHDGVTRSNQAGQFQARFACALPCSGRDIAVGTAKLGARWKQTITCSKASSAKVACSFCTCIIASVWETSGGAASRPARESGRQAWRRCCQQRPSTLKAVETLSIAADDLLC